MVPKAGRRVRATTLVAAAAGLALALAAPAGARDTSADPAADNAQATLEAAEQALSGDPGATAAPDASVELNDLSSSYQQLQGSDRDLARGLLARPTDGAADQYGDGYPDGAPIASAESPHFCLFWVDDPAFKDAPELADANGNGIPDYAETIIAIAEYSYGVEVTPGAMGWLPPKRDTQGCGADPGAHTDLYLKQLGAQGLFGYESPDPGQGRARSRYGYMVLDNDYAEAEYGYADPAVPASVTVAHEFNHILQQNYDSFEDIWMFEATAVWTEEQVFPNVNDYVHYVPDFAHNPGSPITDATASKGLKIYGSAVWNHWLDRGAGYGPAVVRRAWEVSDVANPADFAVAAYGRAIGDRGGRGFEREFVRFAAATAEWRTGYGKFPDAASYPDMKRRGSLGKGGPKRFRLDHTAYRLFDVNAGGAGKLKLSVDVADGDRSGLALVARDGDALGGGVVRKSEYLSHGGKGSVTLANPGRFERITAVLVNADGRVKGFLHNDWVYSKDAQPFEARLSG